MNEGIEYDRDDVDDDAVETFEMRQAEETGIQSGVEKETADDHDLDAAVMTGLGDALRSLSPETVDAERAAREAEEDLIAAEEKAIAALEAAESSLEKKLADFKAAAEAKQKGLEERARKMADLAAKKKALEDKTNQLRAELSATSAGNRGSTPDIHGKKQFLDMDNVHFSVSDQKKAFGVAQASLLSRRLTEQGRHLTLYGEEGIELETKRIHEAIVCRGKLDVFGYGSLTTEELVCWAPIEVYELVSELPAMSADGTHTLHSGEITHLGWFSPKGTPHPTKDLGVLRKTLEDMELVYMVQHSMVFQGMNEGLLASLLCIRNRYVNRDYIIYWIEGAMATFNRILRARYPTTIPSGWPSDVKSCANARRLWVYLMSRIDHNLEEFQQREFERTRAKHGIPTSSMKADMHRARHGASSPHSRDSSDSEDDVLTDAPGKKRKRKSTRGKAAKTTGAGKVAATTPPKERVPPVTPPPPVKEKGPPPTKDKATPKENGGAYCGAHLIGLLKLGPTCQYSTCKFVHLTDVSKAEMFRVDRSLCTGWGMKLGQALQLKVWNTMVGRTGEGAKRVTSFEFKANQPAFAFGKDA